MGAKHTPGRGKLKIFLGYAPGVGKTFDLLDEAHRRKRRGQDVVIGVVDSAGRKPIADLLEDFETVGQAPPGRAPELDLDALLARKPDLVVVDDLAHQNSTGSRNEHRWQDVEDLLRNGINVLSTLNVSNLESLNDHVADITGVKESDTVPDRVLAQAYEVELVDLTPRALINRLERGDIFPGKPVVPEQTAFFREGNLSALREMAMREAASHVDEDLVEYRKEKRIEKPWAAQDRVMICLSPTRTSLRLIRRGWRMGQRMHGEVIAVHVEDGPLGDRERKVLADDFKLAERLGIETVTLKGELAPTLISFAKERNVTQMIMGHPDRTRIQSMMKPSVLSELVKALKTLDILIVATETEAAKEA
jgi:two-component system, OmpR family, sensor histidine kinase KdpD